MQGQANLAVQVDKVRMLTESSDDNGPWAGQPTSRKVVRRCQEILTKLISIVVALNLQHCNTTILLSLAGMDGTLRDRASSMRRADRGLCLGREKLRCGPKLVCFWSTPLTLRLPIVSIGVSIRHGYHHEAFTA